MRKSPTRSRRAAERVTCRHGGEVTDTYTRTTVLSPFNDELWCEDEILPGPFVGSDGTTAVGRHDGDPMVSSEWSFVSVPESLATSAEVRKATVAGLRKRGTARVEEGRHETRTASAPPKTSLG